MAREALSSRKLHPHLNAPEVVSRRAQQKLAARLRDKTFEQLQPDERDQLIKLIAIRSGLIKHS